MKFKWIKIAFVFSFLWWTYLFFTSQYYIVYDSIGYEGSGKIIAYHSWAELLRGGPQREPLFSLLVALSMRLGDCWGIAYSYPFKMIGILFLLLTMIFSYRLMKMLSIRPIIAALIILYMGISPIMTNSSMRLWSEFAAYPWVLLAVIWTIKSCQLLDLEFNDPQKNMKIIGHAGMLALMFLLIMSVKAVAEGVLLCYLWPFYWKIFFYWRSKNFVKFKQVLIFCLTVLLIFEGMVSVYKWCNYHYNGHYTFTTRGDWALWGNTARRMKPLTIEKLKAAVAYVPGMGLCTSIFPQEDCYYWSPDYSDSIIWDKFDVLNKQGIKDESATKYFIYDSFKMVLLNPLQEIILMVIEAHKMFFWESSLAFVAYPDWIDKYLYSTDVLYSLRIIFALLSWSACIFVFCFLYHRRRKSNLKDSTQEQCVFWVINFIFWYMTMYSLFFILDRYSFPLISLYLVLIAFLIDKISKLGTR